MATAILIFFVAYIAIVSEKFPRHWVALLGGSLLVAFGVMSIEDALNYISWETIGLLAGMFLLISILQEGGFFFLAGDDCSAQGQLSPFSFICGADIDGRLFGSVYGQYYCDVVPCRPDSAALPFAQP